MNKSINNAITSNSKLQRNRSLLERYIPNLKERKLVKIVFFTSLLFFLVSLFFIPSVIVASFPLQTRSFTGLQKNIGSLARIAFFFAVAIYPIYLLLQYKKLETFRLKNWNAKQLIVFVAKIARKWHVPVALVGASFASVHAYMAILDGVKWLDLGYISGFLALIVLGVLSVLGLFRYKKLDRRWHLYLGVSFVFLFIMHTFLASPFNK